MTGSGHHQQLPRPPASLVRGASLFLDFDGTLVEIAADPAAVEVTSELRSLLTLLQERLDGRVAVLTGRAADDVEAKLHPARMVLGGSHGLETRINGASAVRVERPPALDRAIAQLRVLQQRHPGILVEEKPLGVALHYRQAPEAEDACRQAATEAARSCGLELQPGKMVFELKPPGGNKGAALRSIMEEPGFAGTVPLFLGDDLTDEPGFEAARELGGAGVLVGEQRATAATFGIPTVGEALDWLREAAEEAR